VIPSTTTSASAAVVSESLPTNNGNHVAELSVQSQLGSIGIAIGISLLLLRPTSSTNLPVNASTVNSTEMGGSRRPSFSRFRTHLCRTLQEHLLYHMSLGALYPS
jgi:hypothetical protein